MPIVETKNLTKKFMQGTNEIFGANSVSIKIEQGELVAITGKSGSGKTTLLNLIGGIDTPTSGEVLIEGVSICDMDDEALSKIRRTKIGYVFQDFKLFPILTAEENIIMPLILDGKKPNEEDMQKLAAKLNIDDRLKHLPSELSGGQKQRVAIARALIAEPKVILADEPTGNLDKTSADELMQLFVELNDSGHTIIIVTHDDTYASMCKRKITLVDGAVVTDNT